MKRFWLLIMLLFLSQFFLLPICRVFATTIWCNPSNVSLENGFSKETGFSTLHKALSTMMSGDMVIIANGDWRNRPEMFIDEKHVPSDGTDGNYSKVRAETDFDVKLPHISIMSNKTYGYLEFRGIVFDNKYSKKTSHVCYDMHHTKFIRCGFLAHGIRGNAQTCGFNSADSSRSRNQFNLMEECIAWGSGRYVFICRNGKYNIFRRCVARHDVNREPQMFNFRAYACDYTFYQNCISIDSDRIEYYAKPIYLESGGYWVGDQYGAIENAIEGCISIKDIQVGFYVSGKDKDSAIVKDCVALDMTYKKPEKDTFCALLLTQGINAKIQNFTGIGAKLKKTDGIYCRKSGKKTIENCIIGDVDDEGVGINPSSDSVTVSNVAYFNVGGGQFGKDSVRINPFKHGLMYPVRIEAGAKLAKLGKNETVCGATILNKIGVSGTLYGEPGWDEITTEKLWPFPNEKKIRGLMRETVDEVSGQYGFCENGQTLTNYIWGYFGNLAPPFNLKAKPEDESALLTWDKPADIALDRIKGFNVYDVTGRKKILMGGTVQGNSTYSKKVMGLMNGKSYDFAVTAIDAVKGESGYSYKIGVLPDRIVKSPESKGAVVEAEKPGNITQTLKTSSHKNFINKLGMAFVFISPGSFKMGILSGRAEKMNNAMGQKVTLSKGFYMQTTEVTQSQWKELMGENPAFFKNCGDDCPAEQVSWNGVQEFIKRLNRMEETGKYRLPTEAEWEYACRAGTQTPFSFGKCLTINQANYCGDYPYEGCNKGVYRQKPIPVNSFPPNSWQLIGMHGNVWEWCQDRFGQLPTGPVIDPKGPSTGNNRVFKGGGWNSFATACRSSNRSGVAPAKYFANLGFRLVKEP